MTNRSVLSLGASAGSIRYLKFKEKYKYSWLPIILPIIPKIWHFVDSGHVFLWRFDEIKGASQVTYQNRRFQWTDCWLRVSLEGMEAGSKRQRKRKVPSLGTRWWIYTCDRSQTEPRSSLTDDVVWQVVDSLRKSIRYLPVMVKGRMLFLCLSFNGQKVQSSLLGAHKKI